MPEKDEVKKISCPDCGADLKDDETDCSACGLAVKNIMERFRYERLLRKMHSEADERDSKKKPEKLEKKDTVKKFNPLGW